MKLTKQTKSKERLALELKKNKQKMDAICDMEKKIEKYEFVLNIEKYKKVKKNLFHSLLMIDPMTHPTVSTEESLCL